MYEHCYVNDTRTSIELHSIQSGKKDMNYSNPKRDYTVLTEASGLMETDLFQ